MKYFESNWPRQQPPLFLRRGPSSAMFPLRLPYFADPKTLPYPIPTVDEIHRSEDAIEEVGGRRVVGVGPYAVKFGRQVDLAEGENMLFVAHSTSLPVPRVYALFRDPQNNKGYIVMERITANTLLSEWPSLTKRQKEAIAMKLGSFLKELRCLPSPGGYCSLGYRPLLDDVFWNGSASEKYNGPFRTEEEFNEAMIEKYLFNNGSQNKAEFYKQSFPAVFKNHPPVFTHGDFQRKNIVLRSVGDTERDVDLVFLDWEFAGWYPNYWEYSRALFACGMWDDDWGLWVNTIFAPDLYLNEWAWMRMLLLELWS
jgi:aminoglycoside phosphotransferase (APT) family kinase protein